MLQRNQLRCQPSSAFFDTPNTCLSKLLEGLAQLSVSNKLELFSS